MVTIKRSLLIASLACLVLLAMTPAYAEGTALEIFRAWLKHDRSIDRGIWRLDIYKIKSADGNTQGSREYVREEGQVCRVTDEAYRQSIDASDWQAFPDSEEQIKNIISTKDYQIVEWKDEGGNRSHDDTVWPKREGIFHIDNAGMVTYVEGGLEGKRSVAFHYLNEALPPEPIDAVSCYNLRLPSGRVHRAIPPNVPSADDDVLDERYKNAPLHFKAGRIPVTAKKVMSHDRSIIARRGVIDIYRNSTVYYMRTNYGVCKARKTIVSEGIFPHEEDMYPMVGTKGGLSLSVGAAVVKSSKGLVSSPHGLVVIWQHQASWDPKYGANQYMRGGRYELDDEGNVVFAMASGVPDGQITYTYDTPPQSL